jgi:acyl carrier protein
MPSPNTMPMTDVDATVRTFIADNYLYREGIGSIADTDSFLTRGIIDSMGILELVTFLESTFGISVTDDEVVPENLDSVARVAAYVRRKLGA